MVGSDSELWERKRRIDTIYGLMPMAAVLERRISEMGLEFNKRIPRCHC